MNQYGFHGGKGLDVLIGIIIRLLSKQGINNLNQIHYKFESFKPVFR